MHRLGINRRMMGIVRHHLMIGLKSSFPSRQAPTTTAQAPTTTAQAPTTAQPAPTQAPQPTTFSTSATATSSAPVGAQTLYGQCGGKQWTGATACAEGSCTMYNDYYAQCVN